MRWQLCSRSRTVAEKVAVLQVWKRRRSPRDRKLVLRLGVALNQSSVVLDFPRNRFWWSRNFQRVEWYKACDDADSRGDTAFLKCRTKPEYRPSSQRACIARRFPSADANVRVNGRAMLRCRLSERIWRGLFSVLCLPPVYLNAGNTFCRAQGTLRQHISLLVCFLRDTPVQCDESNAANSPAAATPRALQPS